MSVHFFPCSVIVHQSAATSSFTSAHVSRVPLVASLPAVIYAWLSRISDGLSCIVLLLLHLLSHCSPVSHHLHLHVDIRSQLLVAGSLRAFLLLFFCDWCMDIATGSRTSSGCHRMDWWSGDMLFPHLTAVLHVLSLSRLPWLRVPVTHPSVSRAFS